MYAHGWAILASWLVDYMEHANLVGVKCNVCRKCQTPKVELGMDILRPDFESHWRRSGVIQEKYWNYQNAKIARNRQAMTITENWFGSVSARLALCII
jgi:hypothetical protein